MLFAAGVVAPLVRDRQGIIPQLRLAIGEKSRTKFCRLSHRPSSMEGRWAGEMNAEELIALRQGWCLGDPWKLALAGRLRKETALTLQGIAARLQLGISQSAKRNPRFIDG